MPRTATRVDLPIRFREGLSMLIPFLEVPMPGGKEMPIREIIIGPTPHKELSRNSLVQFLKSKSLGDVEVKFSEIPFRNW